ncbi:hypothetical protein VTL71DRAFT_12117 [Oculimacula yallundae]|uniref:Uncharacterized protein n=1 Tax=Oculimacula yallundae TaxID=86028 RepID=A0ABR4CS15_9HELO
MKYSFAGPMLIGTVFISCANATTVHIKNSCAYPIHYAYAYTQGADPEIIIPSQGTHQTELKEALPNGKPDVVSMKFHKGAGLESGILQVEMSKEIRSGRNGDEIYSTGFHWNLSHNDGQKSGSTGLSPFRQDDVVVRPQGAGTGQGTRSPVICPKHSVCKDSYQFPTDDLKMRHCPIDLGGFEIETCPPNGIWKRAQEFFA